jgi:hypothetical protein
MSEADGAEAQRLWEIWNKKPASSRGVLDNDRDFPNPNEVPTIDVRSLPKNPNINFLLLVGSTVSHCNSLGTMTGLKFLQLNVHDLASKEYSNLASLSPVTQLGIYSDHLDDTEFIKLLKSTNAKVVSLFKPSPAALSALCEWANPKSLFLKGDSMTTANKNESISLFDDNSKPAALPVALKHCSDLQFVECHGEGFAKLLTNELPESKGWRRTD